MATSQQHPSLLVAICSWACLGCSCKLESWPIVLRGGKGVWGILSPPAMSQSPFVVEAEPSISVFLSCILLYKSKGHSVVEEICKTRKRVVEIPYGVVNALTLIVCVVQHGPLS